MNAWYRALKRMNLLPEEEEACTKSMQQAFSFEGGFSNLKEMHNYIDAWRARMKEEQKQRQEQTERIRRQMNAMPPLVVPSPPKPPAPPSPLVVPGTAIVRARDRRFDHD